MKLLSLNQVSLYHAVSPKKLIISKMQYQTQIQFVLTQQLVLVQHQQQLAMGTQLLMMLVNLQKQLIPIQNPKSQTSQQYLQLMTLKLKFRKMEQKLVHSQLTKVEVNKQLILQFLLLLLMFLRYQQVQNMVLQQTQRQTQILMLLQQL